MSIGQINLAHRLPVPVNFVHRLINIVSLNVSSDVLTSPSLCPTLSVSIEIEISQT